MRSIASALMLGLMMFASGCATETTCDMRSASEVCEIHHTYMDTVQVANEHMPAPTEEYLQARNMLFRHSFPYLLPEKCKSSVIYVCKDCVRDEKEWRRRHSVTK